MTTSWFPFWFEKLDIICYRTESELTDALSLQTLLAHHKSSGITRRLCDINHISLNGFKHDVVPKSKTERRQSDKDP